MKATLFATLLATAPENSLLHGLASGGSFTDCYALSVPRAVTQAQFIEAFYTTRLFKTERFILKYLALKPSTDQDARDLAAGKAVRFAIWRVAQQTPEQLLLTDQRGVTSSWLMATPKPGTGAIATTLYFGSAVTGRTHPKTGKQTFGKVFHALLGLHAVYSRHLLQAAAAKLMAQPG